MKVKTEKKKEKEEAERSRMLVNGKSSLKD